MSSPEYASVEELLAAARSRISRVDPEGAVEAVRGGALIVDIRPEWQRRVTGEIAGSVIIERNHLEWRLHPDSDARIQQARREQQWVVVCAEGYTSSLAAAALVSLGVPAVDVEGGVAAWTAAGLPLVPGTTPVEQVVRTPPRGDA